MMDEEEISESARKRRRARDLLRLMFGFVFVVANTWFFALNHRDGLTLMVLVLSISALLILDMPYLLGKIRR